MKLRRMDNGVVTRWFVRANTIDEGLAALEALAIEDKDTIRNGDLISVWLELPLTTNWEEVSARLMQVEIHDVELFEQHYFSPVSAPTPISATSSRWNLLLV